jgi:poly-gamma-glutamate synthesis protein (capsule biosynthesis protein)
MERKTVKLTAVGDVMLGDSPFCLGHGVKSKIKRKGIDYYVKEILKITDKSDFNFANLECILSGKGRNKLWIGSEEMRGTKSFLHLIDKAKWNIINVANNHIFQHGYAAYYDTVKELKRLGIIVIGDDSQDAEFNLAVVEKKGIRIGFVGFSLHYEQYHRKQKIPYSLRLSYDQIIKEIYRIKKAFQGSLVVSLHWGYEFMEQPSLSQQEFAHHLIDLGAILILGHHAHVVQGFEIYKNGLIAYNLGNFIFDQFHEKNRDTIALSVDISKTGVENFSLIPMVIDSDYCPRVATPKDRKKILAHIIELNMNIEAGRIKNDNYLEAMAASYYKKWRIDCYFYFIRNLYKFNPLYSFQSIIRAILRRLKLVHNP